jgi:hypothetical protein
MGVDGDQFKNAREASTPMYKLESPATALSRQFAELAPYQDLAIITLTTGRICATPCIFRLNGQIRIGINSISPLLPVTVS